jgi:glycosyltransferase involved in cell wall biosynthesis
MGLELYAACQRAGVQMSAHATDGDATTVVHVMIPPMVKGWLDGQRPIIFTMYETTDCPAQFRSLQDFEQVLVPCEANVEAFSRWHPNVKRVPLGVDPKVWKQTARPDGGPFTFLTSGSEPRKGADVTAAAFRAAFPNDPDVRLLVKFPTSSPVSLPNDPRIQVVGGYLGHDEELALYASAHCYVGLSRGEGFGMMPLQAMAQGCPTILTDAHGHAEFAKYGLPVGFTLVPAASYMRYGEAGDWWEPSFDDAVEQMRHVRDNYDKELRRAVSNGKKVRAEFTWDRSAEQLLDAVGRDRLTPYTGSCAGRKRTELNVPVQVKSKVNPDIGNASYRFEPGVEYWVPANVKDVLRQAGYVTDESWQDWRYRAPEVVSL